MPMEFFQAEAAREPRWLVGRAIILLLLGLTGCSTLGKNKLLNETHEARVVREIMARNGKIVLLSPRDLDRKKPVLVLLHGATEDPTEMMEIVRDCSGKYNVLLYAYNHHRSIKRLACDFVSEMGSLRERMKNLQ